MTSLAIMKAKRIFSLDSYQKEKHIASKQRFIENLYNILFNKKIF